uniref:Arf-GAP with coiled-coil, ANK repeat and PH domain-containing protein n=1 Tax=Electrophorus electricus TaxID=8005 RepID=A0A4W4DYY0_ELEEL
MVMCRATIEDVEGDVGELESKLDRMVKLCIGMIDAGRAYSQANKQFVNGIRELALQSMTDDVIGVAHVHRVSLSVPPVILFDQAQRSIKSQLQVFVKEDLRKFKEAKKQFDKVSEEKELAQVKNAQAPRNKQHEVEEATNLLTTTRKCFRHIALDYVLQINVLQSKKRLEILKSMLSFMNANMSFFQQGYSLFSELQPLMKQLGGQLDQLVVDSAKEKRDMEQQHSAIQQQDFSTEDTKLDYNMDTENGVAMEGYLFKRASNAFKTWNRRWFSIQNSQLVYQKKFWDNPTIVVEDLRLCTVKQCEDVERRFCFEVVSPTKSCMLQADSEKLRHAWTKAVQNSIATAYRENGDGPTTQLDRLSSASVGSLDSLGEAGRGQRGDGALQRVLAVSGNAQCCDCGQSDPRWASINLGITLCIECSGIHRSLGVHNSKVRSLTLDSWEPELLKLMCELGNGVINQIYEARRAELGWRKPQPGDSRQEIEAYVRAKYVDRRFVQRPNSQEQRSKVMVLSKRDRRLKGSMELLPPPQPSGQEVRRDSLFCPDELDSLFSYFDTSSKLPAPGWPLARCLSALFVKVAPKGRFSVCVSELQDSESLASLSQQESSPVFTEPPEFCPSLLLYWASYAGSLLEMVQAVALGANVNWANGEEHQCTALLQAVQSGSLVTCEFLLQNAANVDQSDARGRGPLHHATMLGHTGQVCLFLKRGAQQGALDMDERSPLSIAVEAANADIVTLLRLAKMSEEMRESEGPLGQPGQYSHSQSHTEQQYRKCMQDFISQELDEA